MKSIQKLDQKRILSIVFVLAGLYIVFNMQEWSRIPAAFLIGSVFIFLAWKHQIKEKQPTKLLYLLIAAFLIRFALGALWTWALPEYGYDNQVNDAGYVMKDAYSRDQAAWELSRSDTPLLEAFDDYSHTDQYGGILFLSAGIYRYLGGSVHQPLMIVAIFSAISALSVLFVWLVAEKLWNKKTAFIAAWFLVLYPEACLLGSTQMREAIIPTITLAVIFLILKIQEKFAWKQVIFLLLLFLLSFMITTPFGAVLVAISGAIIALPYYKKWVDSKNKYFSAFLSSALLATTLVAVWFYIDKIYGAWYQQYLSLRASGVLTIVLENLPESIHTSMVTIYGVFRPLLPAALTDLGNPLWQGIAIWRSLGWTALLFVLLLSTVKVIQEKKLLHLTGLLTIINWIWVFISSYRSGGDMWDNPRYRAYFVGIQVLLGAWVIADKKVKKNPWVRRGLISASITIVLYMLLYIDRNIQNFGWPFADIRIHVLVSLITVFVYLVIDLLISRKKNP